MRRPPHRWIWPIVTLLAAAGVVLGAARGDFGAVSRWAHTLCTACVGLGK